MSPVGLDVKEYAYSFIDFTPGDGAPHVIGPVDTGGGWWVTRVQLWNNGAGNASLFYQSVGIDPIAPQGCLELLPGGAMRGPLVLTGQGCRILIEYWYRPAPPNGDAPTIAT